MRFCAQDNSIFRFTVCVGLIYYRPMKRQYLSELPADAVPIPDFPKCFATPDGRIITQHGRTKLRRFGLNGCGYPVCGIVRSDGKHCFPLVHRIIAKLFVPGDQSLTVNHKDENKSNVCASNLEWITFSDNHKKAHELHPERGEATRKRISRAIIATHPETGERHEFASGKQAAQWVGNPTASGNISKALGCVTKIAYGFHWSRKG